MQRGVAGPTRLPKASLDVRGAMVPVALPPLATVGSVSASVVSRERVYATRDMDSSIDPGPLTAGTDTIEEEDEEEEEDDDEKTNDTAFTGEAKTPAEKFAKKILQKSRQSGVPDSAMWRSVAS